jgi:argininosuccinate synthase
MAKVALAYSGGLDTSVCLRWLQENKGLEVVAVAIDVGEERDYASIRDKALKLGAVHAEVVDAKAAFAEDYIMRALQANAMYEGKYPVATALARPLIAEKVAEVAVAQGASVLAHGSTGKGNDQVRFEVSWACLCPEMDVIAPVREWGMTREEEIEYAEKHGIPIPVDKRKPYSTDVNLWGRSAECGVLEDPWVEPPADAYEWTRAVADTPDTPAYVEIGFELGRPVSLDGAKLAAADLIAHLNTLGGEHGVGRIDMIENRLVGIKSREIYECPAATILLAAHRDLETLTFDRETQHFKQGLDIKYAELVYFGLWFTPLRRALDAFNEACGRMVTGAVRVKLFKGSCTVVGRRSPRSQYRFDLATYDRGDQFDQQASRGFVDLWGLPAKVAAIVEREAEQKK